MSRPVNRSSLAEIFAAKPGRPATRQASRVLHVLKTRTPMHQGPRLVSSVRPVPSWDFINRFGAASHESSTAASQIWICRYLAIQRTTGCVPNAGLFVCSASCYLLAQSLYCTIISSCPETGILRNCTATQNTVCNPAASSAANSAAVGGAVGGVLGGILVLILVRVM